MFNRPVNSFVPAVYEGIIEMQDIMTSEEQIMSTARRELMAAFANTFVLTSDTTGVIMFERMLNITADDQAEDLEFRRERIINRLSMSPPFTFRFLEGKLNEIIGIGAWSAYVDFNNHTLYVETSASNQNWYSEIEFTINRIKPCNMVFVNVPRVDTAVRLNEEISYKERNWRYRLGAWKLGAYPFATLDGGGVIKMSKTRSIQSALLNDTAECVSGIIASVLLNDTIRISEFTLKEVSDNVVCVEYSVVPEMTSLITDIKLCRADGTVLTQSTVYVPVTQNILSKHIITVKEDV